MHNIYLATAYGLSQLSLQRNTEGVSQAESLISAEPGGNCINWNLGHILVSRGRILQQLGGAPVLSEAETLLYQRGSVPLGPDSTALTIDRLIRDLETSAAVIAERLKNLEPGALDRVIDPFPFPVPVEQPTLGTLLALLLFHEGYHAGQVGLGRRLAGKPGQIK